MEQVELTDCWIFAGDIYGPGIAQIPAALAVRLRAWGVLPTAEPPVVVGGAPRAAGEPIAPGAPAPDVLSLPPARPRRKP